MLECYWEVSRCWQDHTLAIELHMSVERAIKTLHAIQQRGQKNRRSVRLSRMAGHLLQEIIRCQVETDKTLDEASM